MRSKEGLNREIQFTLQMAPPRSPCWPKRQAPLSLDGGNRRSLKIASSKEKQSFPKDLGNQNHSFPPKPWELMKQKRWNLYQTIWVGLVSLLAQLIGGPALFLHTVEDQGGKSSRRHLLILAKLYSRIRGDHNGNRWLQHWGFLPIQAAFSSIISIYLLGGGGNERFSFSQL